MIQPQHISFIGAGNVATHLAKALKSKGHQIDFIISRNKENAQILAEAVGASASDNVDSIENSQVIVIAANDDSVLTIARGLNAGERIVAHTSGSVPIEALEPAGKNVGVFYPLQTFHKDKELDITKVPFCIEGSNECVEDVLLGLAESISDNVQLISSEQRKILHVAAVFACNFSNHFYAVASDILKRDGMSLDLLRPLIAETAQQIAQKEPFDLQTGPAVRNDTKVIVKHLEFLEDKPEYQDLYALLTESIQKMHGR